VPNEPQGKASCQLALEVARVATRCAARVATRCGARRKSDGKPCQRAAMRNGRCYVHGGPSTGPRTPEGLERSRKANWKHGCRSQEAIARRREAKNALWNLRAVLNTYRLSPAHAAVSEGNHKVSRTANSKVRESAKSVMRECLTAIAAVDGPSRRGERPFPHAFPARMRSGAPV
jgi:hypothetical protein